MLSAIPGGMWRGTRCPPSHTITSPPQLDRGIKVKKGLTGQDKDRQITQQLPSWAKQTRLGEIYFISYQSSQSKVKRNKNQSKKHLPLTPSFFLGSASLPGSLLPSPSSAGEQGVELQSVQHMLSLPFLPPQGEDSSHSSLLQHEDPLMGDSLP